MIGSKWARNGSQKAGSSSRWSTRASSAGRPSSSLGRIASHRLCWGLVVRSIIAPIRCGARDRADSFAIRTPKQLKRQPNQQVNAYLRQPYFRAKYLIRAGQPLLAEEILSLGGISDRFSS